MNEFPHFNPELDFDGNVRMIYEFPLDEVYDKTAFEMALNHCELYFKEDLNISEQTEWENCLFYLRIRCIFAKVWC